jgi:micrococcal nuclease
MARRGRKRKPVTIAAVVLLMVAVWAARELPRFRPAPGPESEWRQVVRVVDGDTLVLDGNERVRLIGVDTPETVHPSKPVEHFGREASAFTKRMAEGRRVRLEFDRERTDRYGRTLAYVYLEDGTLLNAEIIRQGYGHAYTRFPFRYLDEFRALEREAREAQRGLWAEE